MNRPPALLVDCRATLGEGLLWHAPSSCWFWSDIESRRIWRHDPAVRRTWTIDMPDRVGAFVVTREGRLLAGMAKLLAWADPDWEAGTAVCTPLAPVEADDPTTRVNDGRTDRSGHFVFGTMSEAAGHPRHGHIYQFSHRAGLRRLALGPVGIANSICFSPSGDTLYYCDSIEGTIMACDYDPESAVVKNPRRVVAFEPDAGMPDGSIVDATGAIWTAVWGGGCVRRFSADGVLLGESPVPAAHVTCPAFGGPDLRELCVTTARMEVAPAELAAQPETGGTYIIDAQGAQGLPDVLFGEDA